MPGKLSDFRLTADSIGGMADQIGDTAVRLQESVSGAPDGGKNRPGGRLRALAAAGIALLLLAGHAYTAARAAVWLALFCPAPLAVLPWPLFLLLPCCLMAGFLLPKSRLRFRLKAIGSCWIGGWLYLLLLTAAYDLTRALARALGAVWGPPAPLLGGAIVLAATGAIYLGGVLNARRVVTRRYAFTLRKANAAGRDHLRLACCSDLHLGDFVGPRHCRRVAAALQAAQADLLLLAGDLFDHDFSAVRRPEQIAALLRDVKRPDGAFACPGNHDRNSGLGSDPRLDAFFRAAGIELLCDRSVTVAGLALAGADDVWSGGTARKPLAELWAQSDPALPRLLLIHQPERLEEARQADVDLLFCGHTHGGQLFPLTLLGRFLYRPLYGRHQRGGTEIIVTSGAGYWGPPLRVGSASEIVVIDLTFAPSAAGD